MANNDSQIILYQTEDGRTKIDVRVESETVWLSQVQIADLFQTTKQNISTHITNILKEGELERLSVVKDYFTTAADGKRYNTKSYNLNMIIAIGYRVRSIRGTQFRQWATTILHEYMQKGFALNDEKLKEFGGGDYWYELLERIRDIRSSEKAFYRQVLDLYATSIDYDSKQPETHKFFQIVQNKMHYASSKQTAAELIYNRANSEQPFMGLTSFKGKQPRKTDIDTAKNYMTKDELYILNRIVSAFFDVAELKAHRHEHMYMRDWLAEIDKFTNAYGEATLVDAGSITHEAAVRKANEEYAKYRRKTTDELSPIEVEYLSSIKDAQKQIERAGKRKPTRTE
ncbi:toxin Fic [Clostridia bacterium]|nr:toxin Fic [Clostridia bacterium]